MSEAGGGGNWHMIHHDKGCSAACGAAGWLSLAAAPTFAGMALLTSINGGTPEMLCMHDASVLGGMALMYLLMSVFHSAPWLAMISRRRSGIR